MFALLLVGCAQAGEPRFVRAEVRNVVPGKRGQVPVNVTGEKLGKLLSFFPGVGTGKRNDFSGAWIAGVQIKFFRPDGTAATATTDIGFRYWTEENGDWELDEDFRPFIIELLKLGAPTSQPTKSTQPGS